jgi:CheY-like chemotaxis protein
MRNRPVLVVDDDPRSRDLVTAILTGADFQVLSASDGASGVELARRAWPAVIILDVMMRDTEGIGTLRSLKRDPVLRDIPVVAITDSSDLTCAQKAFRAGALFFLTKPFPPTSLLRAVELSADRAEREAPMHRRRRHPRHRAEIPVWCFVHGDTGTTRGVAGRTANLSLGGLLLLLPETLAPGTAVPFELGLPEGPITAKGKVMWRDTRTIVDGRFHHGVRLLGFTEGGELSLYRRYLNRVAASPPS